MMASRITPTTDTRQRRPRVRDEEWRIIENFPDYEISSRGRVRRLTDGSHMKSGAILKQTIGSRGYFKISLYKNKTQSTLATHFLVCCAFFGPKPATNSQVAHYDGNPLNNCSNNLRWTDTAGNAADRIRHGRQPRGTQINTNKLTECQVKEIRHLAENGLSQRAIAKRFGVTQAAIWAIKHKRVWKHV